MDLMVPKSELPAKEFNILNQTDKVGQSQPHVGRIWDTITIGFVVNGGINWLEFNLNTGNKASET